MNFADDQINPSDLGVVERVVSKVPNGRFVMVPACRWSPLSYAGRKVDMCGSPSLGRGPCAEQLRFGRAREHAPTLARCRGSRRRAPSPRRAGPRSVESFTTSSGSSRGPATPDRE